MINWPDQIEFTLDGDMLIGLSTVCCPVCNRFLELWRTGKGFQAKCSASSCKFGVLPAKPVESSTQLRRILKVYDALIHPNS